MSTVRVTGTAGKALLESYLASGLPGQWRLTSSSQGEAALAVLYLDGPNGALGPGVWTPGSRVDIALVHVAAGSPGAQEIGIERDIKSRTGARKVLVFRGEEERERAFRKVLDIALSITGGVSMPEEIPENVLEAVKREAVDGRIDCERAQELAGELGVPIPVVGRALDLLGIKITSCQLGCF